MEMIISYIALAYATIALLISLRTSFIMKRHRIIIWKTQQFNKEIIQLFKSLINYLKDK